MKEVIKKSLDEFADKYDQVNFDSDTLRDSLADFISGKILAYASRVNQNVSYNDDNDTCCGGNCGCE